MAATRQDIEFNATFNFKKSDAEKLDRLLGDAFTESLQRAAKLGAHKMGEELHKKLSGTLSSTAGAIAAELETLHTQIETLHGELEAATTDAVRVQKQNELKQKQIQVQQKERLINKERAVFDAFLDRQEEALQEYDKLSLRVSIDKKGLAKDLSDSMNDAVSKLNTGEITDIFSSAFSLIGQGGKLAQGKGAAMAAEGAAGGGRAMAMLGTAATGLAAMAGALAGVVAIFGMAYNQAKDLNKALLEGAGSADLFAKGFGDLAPKMKELREATIQVALETRLGTDEVAKYINALNASGVTYKMMSKIAGENVSAQQAYVDVTMTAIKASKHLGIEANEAGEFMNNMIKNLGKTSLPQVEAAFGMIGDAAAQSGMATKDFFTVINESASGLALYNFRLEDTVGLMNEMVEVLGEDLAKTSLALQKRFGEMGMQDRIKTVMTSGGAAGRILKADVGAQGKDLSKSITSGIAPLMGSLAKAGEGGAFALDTKALGDMSEKQLRGILSELRKSDVTGADQMARQLENLRDAAKGAQGGTLAQAEGIGQLSKAGELAMNLTQAQGVLGKPLSEMEGLTRAAFENITGLSGEQYEVLKRLDRSLRAEFEAKGGEKGLGMTFEEALASGQLTDSDAMNEAVEAGMSKMELMSSQILEETTSMSETMKNAVAYFLEKIYGLFESFMSWFDFGGSEEGLAKALTASTERQTQLMEKMSEYSKEASELKLKKTKGTSSPEDEARMKELKGLMEATKESIAGEKKLQKDIGDGYARGKIEVTDEQRVQEQARAELTQEGKIGGHQFAPVGGGASAYTAEAEAIRQRAFQISEREHQQKLYDLQHPVEVAKARADLSAPVSGKAMTAALGGKPMASSTNLSPQDLASLQAYAGTPAGGQVSTDAAAKTDKDKKEEVKQDAKVNKAAKEQIKATKSVESGVAKAIEESSKKEMETYKNNAKIAAESMFGSGAVANALSGKGKLTVPSDADSATLEMLARAGIPFTKTAGTEDFIYRGNGTSGSITPINTMDKAIAMAKPGGPLERVAGGGGGGNVTIIIQGGDLNKVREVVMNTVKLGMNARGV